LVGRKGTNNVKFLTENYTKSMSHTARRGKWHGKHIRVLPPTCAVAGMLLLANGGSIEEKQKLFAIDYQFSNL